MPKAPAIVAVTREDISLRIRSSSVVKRVDVQSRIALHREDYAL
jgi:hypothetical protein